MYRIIAKSCSIFILPFLHKQTQIENLEAFEKQYLLIEYKQAKHPYSVIRNSINILAFNILSFKVF